MQVEGIVYLMVSSQLHCHCDPLLQWFENIFKTESLWYCERTGGIVFIYCIYTLLFNATPLTLPQWTNQRVTLAITLHRLISASINWWMTFDSAELPILPGGKWCALALLNIIPNFPKENTNFCQIYNQNPAYLCVPYAWLLRDTTCFFENIVNQKKVYVTKSPPKIRMVAGTFAWRLARDTARSMLICSRLCCSWLCLVFCWLVWYINPYLSGFVQRQWRL